MQGRIWKIRAHGNIFLSFHLLVDLLDVNNRMNETESNKTVLGKGNSAQKPCLD